jgi:uncharacterized protein (TIGR02453 family)
MASNVKKPKPIAKLVKKPPNSKPQVEAFAGFDLNAMGFWHELSVEMNRDWFSENKERYQQQWEKPTLALLDAVREKLLATYQPAKLAPAKVMRIYRDVRFATDKTPYKTHIGGIVALAGKKMGDGDAAALYFHLGIEEEFLANGIYAFDASQLTRWRKAVVGKPGDALKATIDALKKQGFTVGGHNDYKRIPPGLPQDHPRSELLKLRGLTATFPAIPRGLIHNAGLVKWVVERAVKAAPLVMWLQQHVK